MKDDGRFHPELRYVAAMLSQTVVGRGGCTFSPDIVTSFCDKKALLSPVFLQRFFCKSLAETFHAYFSNPPLSNKWSDPKISLPS